MGWIYQPTPPPEPSKPSYDAFSLPDDPPGLKLCRPCRDGAHIAPMHDCDGPPCQCLICIEIRPTVEAMQEDWELGDRAKGWPDDL